MKIELTFKTVKGEEIKKTVDVEKPTFSLASLTNIETMLKILEVESEIYADKKVRSIVTNIKDINNY